MRPALVILAAGIGNRYGGLKQMDAVGPAGETIIDYSIFDAVRAGFGRVVFVIRKTIESEFREVVFDKLASRLDADYVFQEIEDLPPGFSVPAGRVKPWGTSHAVLAAGPKVREPFAAINADDFYGRGAFAIMADFLGGINTDATSYALVGYELGSTLSEHGSVARGVCDVGRGGRLKGIVERTHIERTAGGIRSLDDTGRATFLDRGTTVSMNFWGFTPTFFGFARRVFEGFLRDNANNPKAELYIPLVINALVESGEAHVHVLECRDAWFGVTYREDKPRVIAAIRTLVDAGDYPRRLWA